MSNNPSEKYPECYICDVAYYPGEMTRLVHTIHGYKLVCNKCTPPDSEDQRDRDMEAEVITNDDGEGL